MNETTAVEIPKINVNLTPCNPKYPTAIVAHSDGEHPIGCPGAPVLVPLPLEPWRTVTMKVRFGECGCLSSLRSIGTHASECRSRLIEVTCSIGGATWAESTVADVQMVGLGGHRRQGNWHSDECWSAPRGTPAKPHKCLSACDVGQRVFAACSDRWALVKAMVLGLSDMCSPIIGQRVLELRQQRDAVFAALTRMERGHAETLGGITDYTEALDRDAFFSPNSISGPMLAAYVKHLIKQVGELS